MNLAPADLRKEGPAYDLPIAAALLSLSGNLPPNLEKCLFVGELSLDGSVRHVDGMLPMAHVAKELGYESLFVPQVDAPEAALMSGIDVYPVDSLGRLVTHFRDYQPYRGPITPTSTWIPIPRPTPPTFRTSRVRSTSSGRSKSRLRAVTTSSCPDRRGSGKTLLARLPAIDPTADDA